MNALPQHAPVLPTRVPVDDLVACVQALDPGSRALLDLSLRRRLPFEAMAGVLHTDPFDLARRRARAVARIAAELDLDGAGVVATVKAALARLPDEAWGVPVVSPSPPQLRAVQAESMAVAARALMDKLREQREADARATETETETDIAEQDTVEMEAIVLPQVDPWPVAATPMAAAYSHHPAFAIEREDEDEAAAVAEVADVVRSAEPTELPPLAQALARAAESERAAAEAAEAVSAPEPAAAPEPEPQPTVETFALPPIEHEPRVRLARGGLLIGLLLALVRLLFGRR